MPDTQSFWQKAWTWLDGNKTIIGGAMLVIAEVIPSNTVLHAVLEIVGGILTGGGILHKYAKGEIPMLKRNK
jgi:hypothetical protein